MKGKRVRNLVGGLGEGLDLGELLGRHLDLVDNGGLGLLLLGRRGRGGLDGSGLLIKLVELGLREGLGMGMGMGSGRNQLSQGLKGAEQASSCRSDKDLRLGGKKQKKIAIRFRPEREKSNSEPQRRAARARRAPRETSRARRRPRASSPPPWRGERWQRRS